MVELGISSGVFYSKPRASTSDNDIDCVFPSTVLWHSSHLNEWVFHHREEYLFRWRRKCTKNQFLFKKYMWIQSCSQPQINGTALEYSRTNSPFLHLNYLVSNTFTFIINSYHWQCKARTLHAASGWGWLNIWINELILAASHSIPAPRTDLHRPSIKLAECENK